jgi:hypothetical protein
MICPAKPALAEDFCVVQKEAFSITCLLYVLQTLDERSSAFIRDKPIFSSKRMLHKNYYSKGSVEKKISVRESQGA